MAAGDPNKINSDVSWGEVISWVVIIALLASTVGAPLGVILLIRRLTRGSQKAGSERINAAAAPRPATVTKKHYISGFGVSALLTLLAIALFSVCLWLSAGLSGLYAADAGFGGAFVWRLIQSAFFFLGGGAALLLRSVWKTRVRRYNDYLAIVGEQEIISLDDISRATGVRHNKLRRELGDIIKYGHFGRAAYIDRELGSLVLEPSAAYRLRRGMDERRPEPDPSSEDSEYMRILRELRELDDRIEDGPISEKIVRIEDVTAKIFRAVEEAPAKLPQIRRFMNYYLPTTLKLLRAYATLERQGVGGENIADARLSIDRILGTLSEGFERQLDQLFQSEAIDISADINVLENMMRQDGLAGGGF